MEFSKAAPIYENALRSSGDTHNLQFTSADNQRRNRSRKKIWLNPPFSKNIQSNIGRQFLHLISKHFPKGHTLHKIFNKNTCKVSYSCMSNVATIIKHHNAKILNPQVPAANQGCNCRIKANCPLDGALYTPSVVYKATVSTEDEPPMPYIRMTEHEFKTRSRNHKLSFNNPKYAAATNLSSYIWDLNNSKKNFTIKWSIVKRSKAYKSGSKQCNLCLTEKCIF